MFSLIITIISIALVAALALATLYYGGDAFNQGRVDAEASKIINQGQQMLGAADLFRANMGRYPNNVAELVSEDYLKTIPVAQATALQSALAASVPWAMPRAATPVFMLAEVDEEVCAKVNERFGTSSVAQTLDTGLLLQCYGVDTDNRAFRVVLAKSSTELAAAVADPVSNELLNPDGDGSGAPSGGGGSVQLGVLSTAFGGPVAGTNVLTGDAGSGYQLSFTDATGVFLTVTNTGTEVITPTIVGSNLGSVYILTADDMVTHWGAADVQEARGWYVGSEFPLCLRNESLDPGESCIVDSWLETAPAYPTLTVDGVTLQVVPGGANLGVSPAFGWPNEYVVRFASGPDQTYDYTLQNIGGVPLTGVTVSTNGAASYTVSHNCPATLPMGASCQATVEFDAASAGDFSANLVLDSNETGPVGRTFGAQAVDAEVVATTTLTPGSGAMTLAMTSVSGPLPALMNNQDPAGGSFLVSVSPGAFEGLQQVDTYNEWNAPLITGQSYSMSIPALCGGGYGPCLGTTGAPVNTTVLLQPGDTTDGDTTRITFFTLPDAEPGIPTSWCVAVSPEGAFGFPPRSTNVRRGPC